MKVTIISKSDLRGGAAVVSYRLMEAMRAEGVDARMLVVEKLSSSPYVEVAASPRRSFVPFVAERLRVFAANGFNRADLFKVDPALYGLPLYKHPWVQDADAVLLGWVNQGMLSLEGVERIVRLGKPVFWAMHDLWCATGICHHTDRCDRFHVHCGECHFLGRCAGSDDLSRKTWAAKHRLYTHSHIRFVAVSRWLAERCRESGLLHDGDVRVIHNPFPIDGVQPVLEKPADKITLVFGAARLDDPIKGLPILVEVTRRLAASGHPLAGCMELVTFGSVRDESLLQEIALPHRHLGMIDVERLREVYSHGHIVVSTSHFETLPGTLVEGMAYGCVPVSFDRGGQDDIVDSGHTGVLVEWNDDTHRGAGEIALAVLRAAEMQSPEMRRKMHRTVTERFSDRAIARQYIEAMKGV